MNSYRKTLSVVIIQVLLGSLSFPPVGAVHGQVDQDLEIVRYSLSRPGLNYSVVVTNGSNTPMIVWWDEGKPREKFLVAFDALFEGLVYPQLSRFLPTVSRRISFENLMNQTTLVEEELFSRGPDAGERNYPLSGESLTEKFQEIWGQLKIPTASPHNFFDFAMGRWDIASIEQLMSGDGTLVGIEIEYALVKVAEESFQYLETNLSLKIRLYVKDVMVRRDGIEYGVSEGEMKVDLELGRWEWFIDRFKVVEAVQDGLNLELRPELTLRMKIFFIELNDISVLQDITPCELMGRSALSLSYAKVLHRGSEHFLAEEDDERFLDEEDVERSLGKSKLEIYTEPASIKGYVRFIDKARRERDGGSDVIRVVSSVLAVGDSAEIYFHYPYFGGGSLRHDPIVGIAGKAQPIEPPESWSSEYMIISRDDGWTIEPLTQVSIPVDTLTLAAISTAAFISVLLAKRLRRLGTEAPTR